MRRVHPAFFVVGLAAVGLLLAIWATYEARRQREDVSSALAAEAILLARALGPGLLAAESAMREVDEQITSKALNNARILAGLPGRTPVGADALERIVLANGLDTVAILSRECRVQSLAGAQPPEAIFRSIRDVCLGETEEAIVGSTIEDGIEHITVAVAISGGGAVLVRIHAESSRAIVQRLGVSNLLQELVGTGGVLYLEFTTDALGGTHASAAWDAGEIPPPRPGAAALREVRGQSVFEVPVTLDAYAGERAQLRVGLDGRALERAAASAMRRTLLVGIVLAGFSLVAAAFAFVSRARALERVDAARRITLAETARRRSERLAAAGTLTAGLAHEVRSPLNAIGIAAQRIERKHETGSECRDFAGRIRSEVRRLENILRQFLELARPVSESRENVDLGQLMEETLVLLEVEAQDRQITLFPPSGTVCAPVNSEAIRRSAINLVRNAIQASPDGGEVEIALDQEGEHAVLRVSDKGSGVEAEMREKVFEAFMTTRAAGTGLGLSLVRRVAEDHGGSCRLEAREGGGTVAILKLPLQEEQHIES